MLVAAIIGRRDRASASTSTASGSARRRRWRSSPAAGDFAAGIMVSASHNPAEDNGLKVLDAARAQARRRGRGRARAADLARRTSWRGPATPSSVARSTPRACSTATASTGSRLARERRRPTCASSLDCANGSGGVVRRPRSSRRPARGSRSSTTSRTASNINLECGATARQSLAAAGRRARGGRRVRPRRRRGPLRRRGRDGAGRRRRPAAGHPRARPARAAARSPTAPLVVSVLSNGGLASRGRGRRRSGRPDAGRRQVHPRRDAGHRGRRGRREERPRHHPGAHDARRRHRDRARGPAVMHPDGRDARRARRARSRSTRSSSAPSACVTRTSGRRSGPSRRPSRDAEAGWRARPDPRPAVGHRAGAADHGRRDRTPRSWSRSWPTRSRPSRASD